MTSADPPIDESVLARFVPINGISPGHLKELSAYTDVVTVEAGKPIDVGDPRSPNSFYLLEGEINVVSGSRVLDTIFARTEKARFSISHLCDKKRSLKAGSRVKLLSLERAKISTLLVWSQSEENDDVAEGAEEPEPNILDSEILSRIPPANVQKIRTVMQIIKVKAGDRVIQQGEPGDYYYFIHRGRCLITRQSDGEILPAQIAELKEGDTFGEEALISDAERNASVSMLTDGVLTRLTKDDFVALIRDPLLNKIAYPKAQEMLNSGAQWLDIRMPEEHASDGFPGSINIPLSSLRLRTPDLDRTTTYIVYCNSGRRSSAGAFLLSERGFNAHVLESGMNSVAEAAESAAAAKPVAVAEEPIDLQAEVVRANEALENAIRLKARAETEKLIAEDGSINRNGDTTAEIQQREWELAAESKHATETLDLAKQEKRESEAKLREAEANAAGERKKAEALVQRLREESEERLRQEDERLKGEYSQAAEKIDNMRRAKEEAEVRFQKEKERLEAELSKAQQEIDSEANKVQSEFKKLQQAASARATEIREKQSSEEEHLRSEMEARLRSERKRLESKFALTVALQDKAKSALEAAESARQETERESARIADQLKAAKEKRHAEEQAQIDRGKKQLEAEAADAKAKLEAAKLEKQELEDAHKEYEGTMARIRDKAKPIASDEEESEVELQLRAELASHDAKLKAVNIEFDDAVRAKADADQAKVAEEEKVATLNAVEEELRLQLYEEMETWLDEERADSEEEVENAKKLAEKEEARQRRIAADRERDADATATVELLLDVESLLGDQQAESKQPIIAQAEAEERVKLARTAKEAASAEKEDARRALETARAKVASLKR
jgi:rhodanese-related sulfurtransferase